MIGYNFLLARVFIMAKRFLEREENLERIALSSIQNFLCFIGLGRFRHLFPFGVRDFSLRPTGSDEPLSG
jgi:hypothetical protein